MMNRIERATQLALEVHTDQVDKGDSPYILHPLRVLCAVEKYIRPLKVSDRESVLCSAVLHDCIEDTKDKDVMYVLIEKEFGTTVIKTVDSLTRRQNETWKTYIDRLKNYWAPRIIKIADLEDNLDDSRLKEITDKDINRNRMYSNTLRKLKQIEESR